MFKYAIVKNKAKMQMNLSLSLFLQNQTWIKFNI